MFANLNTPGIYVDCYNNCIPKNLISEFKREEIQSDISASSIENQHENNSIDGLEKENSIATNGQDYTTFLKPPLVLLAKSVAAATIYIVCTKSLNYITSDIDNPYDFSIDNPWLVAAGDLSSSLYPHFIQNAIVKQIPSIIFKSHTNVGKDVLERKINMSEIFVCAGMEEIVFRKFIQRFALPSISKVLPEKCGNILNHKFTRIALTSALFASIHFSYYGVPMGVTAPLFGGFLFGALAELEDSIALPIASHFLANSLLALQKSNIDNLSKFIFSSLAANVPAIF